MDKQLPDAQNGEVQPASTGMTLKKRLIRWSAAFEHYSDSISSLREDGIDILILVTIQCIWVSGLISLRTGLVNLLPNVIFTILWYWFVKVECKQRFWLYFLPGFILTLRLPVTVAPPMEALNWLLYLVVIGLIIQKIIRYFQQQRQLVLLLVTLLLVLFNSLGHVSLDSPYTYTFRLVNGLESNYTGAENNTTWECPYETRFVAVNCDMRHFIASEQIFTNADPEKVSYSVLLSRFFYGYLSSLTGVEGHRWIASFVLNILLWSFACTAIHRICILTSLNSAVAAIAMLCCASSWGFLHFVGQPSPHLMGYACAAIASWAAIEIIQTEATDIRKTTVLIGLIVAGPLAYQIYPVTVTCAVLLFIYRQPIPSLATLIAPVLFNSFWKNVSLQHFLGTLGAADHPSSGSQNIAYNIKTWLSVVTNVDLDLGAKLLFKGVSAYLYGGLVIGAIASLVFLGQLLFNQRVKRDNTYQLLLIFCGSLCLLTLLATLFITPQMTIWSPSSEMQPRLAFFTYPANTIAIAAMSYWFLGKVWRYAPIVLTFLFSSIDLTGFASFSVLFDYGASTVFWK